VNTTTLKYPSNPGSTETLVHYSTQCIEVKSSGKLDTLLWTPQNKLTITTPSTVTVTNFGIQSWGTEICVSNPTASKKESLISFLGVDDISFSKKP
jgi:hypothetical protein